MTNSAMIDLETMGTGPDAAIVAIGAVSFNRWGITSAFYAGVNLDSAIKCGGEVDGSTINWWMQQNEKARKTICSGDEHIVDAQALFRDWLKKMGVNEIWGNGADFDNVILRRSFERLKMTVPWKYYQNRCYRTVKALNPQIAFERKGTHHSALDDAESQALHLIKILNQNNQQQL